MYGLEGEIIFRLFRIPLLISSQPKPPPSAAKTSTPSTPSAPTSTPAPPPAPQQPTAPTAASNPPATPTPGQTAPPASDSSNFNDPSVLLVGQRGESVIGQMEAMGFQRPEIERAMRAAFFNPDRAIEYLLNGIPERVAGGARGASQQTPSAAATTASTQATSPPAPDPSGDEPINLFEAAAQAGQQGGTRGGAGATASGGAPGATPANPVNMDFLRNSPHFQHLRQLIQQQPAMLEPILQQVAEGNPQLAQMIGQNQDQFLQLLSEVRNVCLTRSSSL